MEDRLRMGLPSCSHARKAGVKVLIVTSFALVGLTTQRIQRIWKSAKVQALVLVR
jgi:hypothetical protein